MIDLEVRLLESVPHFRFSLHNLERQVLRSLRTFLQAHSKQGHQNEESFSQQGQVKVN